MLKKVFGICTLLILPSVVTAKKLETVTVCYPEFREEMVTAVLKFGHQKNIFFDSGIHIKWVADFSGTEKGPSEKKVTKQGSNFNLQAPERYFHGISSELDLLRKTDKSNCDFISTTFEAALVSNVDAKTILPVAVYNYGKDYDTHVLVRKDSEIKSFKDIKGKRVRSSQIGSDISFEAMLKKNNLSWNDLQYTMLTSDELARALDQKKVDVVISYNPSTALLIASDRVRILESDVFAKFYKNSVPHSLLVVTKKFSDSKKELSAKFIEAFKKAAAELAKKPEHIVDLLPRAKDYFSPSQIEKSLSLFQVGLPLVVTDMGREKFYKEAHFSEYQAILQEKGLMEKSVDLSSWQ